MKKVLVLFVLALSLYSCEKDDKLYVYVYHWTDGSQRDWHQYNLIFQERLSDGEIESYRQTEDGKVIERGETINGVVWCSYISYCGTM